MIRIISLGPMTLAAVTGFVAAWYWLQASRVRLSRLGVRSSRATPRTPISVGLWG